MNEAALAAARAAVERGGDADDVLRGVVEALSDRGIGYAAIRFVEDGELVDGPSAGAGDAVATAGVTWEGQLVGELALSADDSELAARVAELIAPYVLVGWDTGGETWEP